MPLCARPRCCLSSQARRARAAAALRPHRRSPRGQWWRAAHGAPGSPRPAACAAQQPAASCSCGRCSPATTPRASWLLIVLAGGRPPSTRACGFGDSTVAVVRRFLRRAAWGHGGRDAGAPAPRRARRLDARGASSPRSSLYEQLAGALPFSGQRRRWSSTPTSTESLGGAAAAALLERAAPSRYNPRRISAGSRMSFAFVFPGQGSQSVGMLAALAAGRAGRARHLRRGLRGARLRSVAARAARARRSELNATERTQPAMLAAGVATWRLWRGARRRSSRVRLRPQPGRVHRARVRGRTRVSHRRSSWCAFAAR